MLNVRPPRAPVAPRGIRPVMAAIAPASGTDLLDLIKKSGILPAHRLAELPRAGELPAEPSRAAAALVQRGFLTRFQAAQLLLGRHKGFRIGQYTIQELLGRGGMGAVYRAEHLELRRSVAIKILAPARGEDPRLAAERFLREGRAAAALDHPNIVRVFDVARHNDTPYLVMEYVAGHTLQRVVDRDGPMPFDAAAECASQAAAGLQHAHEKGFIHRDVKPSNLIRDASGAVKILDMGLARSSSDGDKLTELFDEGAIVGTADFIAPEQAINSPEVDSRADIYSLGATLYTLILGRVPFEGNTTQKLMQHQLKVPPPLHELNPAVPAALSHAVGLMLAKNPSERFRSAAEVVAALSPWTRGGSRVLAGLSGTELARNAEGSVSLSEFSLPGSSVRLRGASPGQSSDFISLDLAEGAKSTIILSASETARSPAREAAPTAAGPAPTPGRVSGRTLALAGLGFGLALAAGVLIGWLAFAR